MLLTNLRDDCHSLLQEGQMPLHSFFPTPTEPPILEDFLKETAVLVKDMMQVIDREIEEAKPPLPGGDGGPFR